MPRCIRLFFFNDTATTEIYTLSLHDALPISTGSSPPPTISPTAACGSCWRGSTWISAGCRSVRCPPCSRSPRSRSEEHTSELQSRLHLVSRLLLEKKKHYQAIQDDLGIRALR